jgi:hypothetical protein
MPSNKVSNIVGIIFYIDENMHSTIFGKKIIAKSIIFENTSSPKGWHAVPLCV